MQLLKRIYLCCAASVHSLATPIGSLLSGPFLDAIGRRGCLQLSAIPLCIGWLIIGFSKNVTSILVGRVVCGVSVGFMAVPSQVQILFKFYDGNLNNTKGMVKEFPVNFRVGYKSTLRTKNYIEIH